MKARGRRPIDSAAPGNTLGSIFATVMAMARRSLAHNFQAVRYGAIMALCWPVTSSAVKFAVDLYGAFPVKRLFWVVLRVFCSERERPFFVPSPAIRSPERAEGVKGPKR